MPDPNPDISLILPELTGRRKFDQQALQTTSAVFKRLRESHVSDQDLMTQLTKPELIDELLDTLLLPREEKVPFQTQWVTILTGFWLLGASRANREGEKFQDVDQWQGSELARFYARALQTHLIESTEPAFNVPEVTTDQRKRTLLSVAKFGLVLGKLDVKANIKMNQEPLSHDIERMLDRAIRQKESVLLILRNDAEKPEQQREFRTDNI